MAVEAQFADAEEVGHTSVGITWNGAPLDRQHLQQWLDARKERGKGEGGAESDSNENSHEGEEGEDEVYDEEQEEEQWGRVEDADWELARGDFTKMFNRSRQLAQIVGQERGSSSNTSGSHTSSIPLPAMNRPRPKKMQQAKIPPLQRSAEKGDSRSSEVKKSPASKVSEQISTLSNDFKSRIQVQSVYDPSATAGGSVSGHVPRKGNAGTGEKRLRDKSDHSTVQQVLDPRTILILFKMLQKGLLKQVNGVISTGKEANVYHASTYKHHTTNEMITAGDLSLDGMEEGIPLALKIYKTTILVFKDRDRYITGEFRFRHGYSRHNPRKMVKLWAEKEARNLKRLIGSGIRCPRPVELRDHVLVMEYLQDDSEEGRNSPRLKDAEDLIDARQLAGEVDIWEQLYIELLVAMRTMFNECRLVHADLSEYNILYHRSHLFIIDVSQSVEHDHPYAFDFLRADITHVDDYFSKKGRIRTLGLRNTFEWIIKPPQSSTVEERGKEEVVSVDYVDKGQEEERRINTLDILASGPFSKIEMQIRRPGESDKELTAKLQELLRNLEAVGQGTQEEQEAKAEDQAVFRQAYIPQTLNEVLDPERDIEKRNEGGKEDLIYKNVIGVDERQGKTYEEEASQSESASDSASASGSDDEKGTDEKKDKTPRGHRHEDRDAKKERKKEVKEAARERRKTKMPKSEKKRRMRTSHK